MGFGSWEIWAVDVVVLTGIMLGLLYTYFHKNYTYWEKQHIPFLKPKFPFGNMEDSFLMRKGIGEAWVDLYKKGEGEKVLGVFLLHRPAVMIRDAELIKTIMTKDFVHFTDHGLFFDEEVDPISAHLFSLGGSPWRDMRAKLSPSFTSGRMKMYFPMIMDIVKDLLNILEPKAQQHAIVDTKEMAAGFTTDVIAACCFGVSSNSMRSSKSEFRQWGLRISHPSLDFSLRNALFFMWPGAADFLKIKRLPKAVAEFCYNMVKETIEYRMKHSVQRRDFMQILIQLRETGKIADEDTMQKMKASKLMHVEMDGKIKKTEPSAKEIVVPEYKDKGKDINKISYDGMTMESAAAQALAFFTGGFETGAATLSFCLFELAKNPDIQTRLREEVDAVLERNNGKLSYTIIGSELDYVDRCIDETLRMYPPIPSITRGCTKTYVIPGTDAIVEKGMRLMIPILGIHNDPQYFPNPSQFDPDRFLPEEKAKRHHFTYLPFGEGPRLCIGLRFGVMQLRIVLTALISNFEFHLSEQTAIPPKLDPKGFLLCPLGGIPLRITPRSVGKSLFDVNAQESEEATLIDFK